MGNLTSKKKLNFLITLMLCGYIMLSQNNQRIKEFSTDFSTFQSELDIFLKTSQNSELKEIHKRFQKSTKLLSYNDHQLIIDISNNMMKIKCRPKPHFKSFLEAVSDVSKENKKEEFFGQWASVAKSTVETTSPKKFLLFCNFTSKFLNENILRSTKSTKWVVDSDSFDFVFEKNIPSVNFSKKLDLNCFFNGDYMKVIGTRGVYYPLLNKWVGGDGVINWKQRGFPEDSVFSQLSNYNIDTRKNKIVADSSIFYNKYLFNEGILGVVENRLVAGNKQSEYPKFTSYKKNIEIKDIFSDIDYKGGYMLQGRDFVTDGDSDSKASIIFKKDGRKFFVASAKRFSITQDKISSKESSVKLFFANDSIYNSNVRFKFLESSRKLEIYCRENKSSNSMINTYHKLKMNFEFLEWNIDTDIITFGALPGSARSIADFESIDMYFSDRLESLRGIDKINPVFVVNNFVKDSKLERFSISQFASSMRISENQIRSYLFPLVEQGFLYFDSPNDVFVVEPMLNHYIDSYLGKSDFDVIAFRSEVNTGDYNINGENKIVNAALNLATNDLNILGVSEIELSSSHSVSIYPKNGKIILKKNRDMIFNGQVYAGKGRLNLFGSRFHFNYEDFKINLNQIEAVQLSVPVVPYKLDNSGNKILTPLTTLIEAVTGDLIIDNPNNKSGLKKDSFPGYPIFRSFEDSYVFYDSKSIYNGVYNRDNFFFHLQPFEIDSLNDYTGKGLSFPGNFTSAQIFPTIQDTLKLQDDYSLGFQRKTSLEGLPIYSGKGIFSNWIYLSNKGLIGTGDFSYLTSRASSDKIIFFPDSSNFKTNSISIDEVLYGIEFPDVKSSTTNAHFKPYLDQLKFDQIKDTFSLFNNKAIFSGDLLLQPTGLTGSGKINLDKLEIRSDGFSYNANWFGADTASLKVYDDSQGIAFTANNLRSYIDLNDREGIFYSNGFDSYVEIPANKYICYIDKLKWDIKSSMLSFGDEEINSSLGSKFVSTSNQTDSISFTAKAASYNLKDYIINASGVDKFLVADAIIEPNLGNLTVSKEGIINTLNNATITVDSSDQYHTFKFANVDILSSKNYIANGYYTYVDALQNTQEIFFDSIFVNDNNITNAFSRVKSNNPFSIGSNFTFRGSIELSSNSKNLIFDGYFKLNHNCNLIDKEWVKFRSKLDPTEITFELYDNLTNDSNQPLFSSLILNPNQLRFYPTFLSQKEELVDLDIVEKGTNNKLIFDEINDRYIISGKDSLSNVFVLYDKACKLEGKGEIDLNLDLGRIDVKTLGEFSHNLNINKTNFNGILMLDFPFSKEAMRIMAEDIYSAPGDGLFEYDSLFVYNISKIFGAKKAKKILYNLEMNDSYSNKFPKELNYSFVFTKLELVWDISSRSYLHKGKIWLGNTNDTETHALLEGYVIIEKGTNGDALVIYLETELYEEYYFEYRDGIMKAWSTNDDFLQAIIDVSESKRSKKAKKEKREYTYSVVSDDFIIENFLEKMKTKF